MQTDLTFLTLDELHIIYKHHFDGALEVVRDMFIMAAFTGLAFIDISNLRGEHVVTDNDGNMWIRKPRQKTEIVQNIPLLDIQKETWPQKGNVIIRHSKQSKASLQLRDLVFDYNQDMSVER